MRLHRFVVAVVLATPLAGLLSGCGNGGDQIPLANVPPPPAIDPSLKKAMPAVPGSSPGDLVYPAPK